MLRIDRKIGIKFITLYLNYLRLLLSIIYYRYVYFDYLPNSLSLSVFSFLALLFFFPFGVLYIKMQVIRPIYLVIISGTIHSDSKYNDKILT